MTPTTRGVAGAVLCGGASRRMGTDKSLVALGGVALADRVAAALDGAACAPVVMVGGDAAALGALGRPVVADRWPGEGPAGGVLTALGALDTELTVVASCDLPLLDHATVTRMIDALVADETLGAVVAHTDRAQRSLTAWRRGVAAGPAAACWARGDRSLGALLAAVPTREVPVTSTAVCNVNDRRQLTAAAVLGGYVDAVAIPEIDVDQLAARLATGARLVDVREPDEYADGHVPGATSIPLGTVPEHVEAFAGDGPTYVICRSGARSLRACEYVAEHVDGAEVLNVAGGTLAWIQSGRDTVGGDQPS